MLTSYAVGELVDVLPEERQGRPNSEGGRAIILDVVASTPSKPSSYSIKYIGVNHGLLSPAVKADRISSAIFDTTARKPRGNSNTKATRPSILSIHHEPSVTASVASMPPPPKKKKAPPKYSTTWFIDQAHSPHGNNGMDALDLLTDCNSKKEDGWLRSMEKLKNPKKSQLTQDEKTLMLTLLVALKTLGDTATAQVAFAWGITAKTVNRIYKKAMESGTMSVARKERSDKGKTVFNDDAKRASVYTTRHAFEKVYRAHKARTNPGEPISKEEIFIAFHDSEEDNPQMLAEAQALAIHQLGRAPYLLAEVTRFLKKTHGSITWIRIATCVAGEGNPLMVNKD